MAAILPDLAGAPGSLPTSRADPAPPEPSPESENATRRLIDAAGYRVAMNGATDRVDRAFAAVPREGFLPAAERWRAGEDAPVPIGRGQTNSQPSTVAAMLRLLDVRPGQRVLDVGAGSGWTTALLAHLTGPAGEVVGVELEPSLARWGAENLAAARCPWARLQPTEPGVLGAPAGAPYDRILVSAGAVEMPRALLDQLADPGRLVVPVQGRMTLVVRERGRDEVSTHGSYRFVPLR